MSDAVTYENFQASEALYDEEGECVSLYSLFLREMEAQLVSLSNSHSHRKTHTPSESGKASDD